MKKGLILLLLVLTLMPVGLFAQKQIVIGMTVPGLQFPFFVTMKNEADAAAAKLGVKLLFIDAQNASDKQMSAVEFRRSESGRHPHLSNDHRFPGPGHRGRRQGQDPRRYGGP